MKFFIYVLFFISLISHYSCTATILKGKVVYTVEQARKEAFNDVSEKIKITDYEDFYKDKNFIQNKFLAKSRIRKYKDRYFTVFSDGNYAITYRNNKNITFYYDNDGNLTHIEFDIGVFFPKKSIAYDSNGNFDSIIYSVSAKESYLFDSAGRLKYKWIGKNCYNENGELIDTRK